MVPVSDDFVSKLGIGLNLTVPGLQDCWYSKGPGRLLRELDVVEITRREEVLPLLDSLQQWKSACDLPTGQNAGVDSLKIPSIFEGRQLEVSSPNLSLPGFSSPSQVTKKVLSASRQY